MRCRAVICNVGIGKNSVKYMFLGCYRMNQIYHKIRQMLSGKRMPGIQTKFKLLYTGIMAIHLLFTIAFGLEGIIPLFWYNLLVTIFYLYHRFVSIQKEQYMSMYVSSGVEILLYVMIATLLLGREWGFAMYCMALIPATFYFSYSITRLRDKLYIPIVSSTVFSIFFIVINVVSDQVGPLYKGSYPDNMQTSFYYFNVIVSFSMLVFFSSLFAMEINYMQRKLEQENHRLDEIANFDPLTHLLNRRSMNQKLRTAHEEAEKKGKAICVMLIDLDDFKKVNDTYGHDCGDEVLISVANVIKNNVREEDAVCRWGGEEILVLVKADLEIARKVAERICLDVGNLVIPYKDMDVRVTLTIGIADYKKKQTVRSMIEEADRNLYYGKHHGKNQTVTSHERIDD